MLKKFFKYVRRLQDNLRWNEFTKIINEHMGQNYPYDNKFKQADTFLTHPINNLLFLSIHYDKEDLFNYLVDKHTKKIKELASKNNFYLWVALWDLPFEKMQRMGDQLISLGFNIKDNYIPDNTKEILELPFSKRLSSFNHGNIMGFFLYRIHEDMQRLSSYRKIDSNQEFEGLLGSTNTKVEALEKIDFYFNNNGNLIENICFSNYDRSYQQTLFGYSLHILDKEIRQKLLNYFQKHEIEFDLPELFRDTLFKNSQIDEDFIDIFLKFSSDTEQNVLLKALPLLINNINAPWEKEKLENFQAQYQKKLIQSNGLKAFKKAVL